MRSINDVLNSYKNIFTVIAEVCFLKQKVTRRINQSVLDNEVKRSIVRNTISIRKQSIESLGYDDRLGESSRI